MLGKRGEQSAVYKDIHEHLRIQSLTKQKLNYGKLYGNFILPLNDHSA